MTAVNSCALFIGNLDWRLTTEDLHKVVSSWGSVAKCEIPQRKNGLSKGYALVTFEAEEAAKQACSELNDTLIGNRRVFTREDRGQTMRTEPREQREPRQPRQQRAPQLGKAMPGTPATMAPTDDESNNKPNTKPRRRRVRKPSANGDVKDGNYGGANSGPRGGNRERAGDKPETKRPIRERRRRPPAPAVNVLDCTDEDVPRLVYVGNLPWKTTEEELKEYFSTDGAIKKVSIPCGRSGQMSKGYGLVLFETLEAANLSIENKNRKEFQERILTVRLDRLNKKPEEAGSKVEGADGTRNKELKINTNL